MIPCHHCASAEVVRYANLARCGACKKEWVPGTEPPVALPVLDAKNAMRLAKQSFADSGAAAHAMTNAAPSPYITMTAANLIKFFQLASKEYQP